MYHLRHKTEKIIVNGKYFCSIFVQLVIYVHNVNYHLPTYL